MLKNLVSASLLCQMLMTLICVAACIKLGKQLYLQRAKEDSTKASMHLLGVQGWLRSSIGIEIADKQVVMKPGPNAECSTT